MWRLIPIAVGFVIGVAASVVATLLVQRSAGWSGRRRIVITSIWTVVGAGILASFLLLDGEEPTKVTQQLTYPELKATRPCGVDESGTSARTAWGPERPVFTIYEPAPYAVLNSIISDELGDERQFFDAKSALHEKFGGFCDSLPVQDGDIVVLRAYVTNSAADNLAGTETFDGPGVARGVHFSVATDQQLASLRVVRASLSSTNTTPPVVFDEVELFADHPFRIDFLPGSGRLYSNLYTDGVDLPSDPWRGEGSLIGFREMDGSFPPGYQYDAILVVRVRITHILD